MNDMREMQRGVETMRVTIRDVAKHANVAVSTASRVITGSGYVSDKTRAKVEKAIEELNYVPNSIARSLKQKQTYSIGLLLADIGNPFYAELAQAVERAAREVGYSVLLANTDGKPDQEKEGIELFIAKQVDGIVWHSPINKDLVPRLSKSEDPAVVVIGGDKDLLGDHTIRINDQLGSFEAVNHLINLGHRDIGYIAEPDESRNPQERMKGYTSALQHAGIEINTDLIVRGTFQEGSGLRAAKILLSGKTIPTAIFCANDLMAIEAMEYARRIGLSVPGDLAVVGFDNTKISGIRGIDLTTVAQPIADMGRDSVALLITSIKENLSPRQILLSPSLVIRKSCGSYLQEAT